MSNKLLNFGMGAVIIMLVLFGSFFVYQVIAPFIGVSTTPEIGISLSAFIFGAIVMLMIMIVKSNVKLARRTVS